MDGPSHYREAERLIKAADTVLEDPRNGAMQQLVMLQGAQVHATLALAAATAATIEPDGSGLVRQWWDTMHHD